MQRGLTPRVMVIGYSPKPTDSGGTPIGMILVDQTGSPGKILRTRFLNDWNQFASQYPSADLEVLKGIAEEIENCYATGASAALLLATIQESFSNTLSVLVEERLPGEDLDSAFEAVAGRFGLVA